MVKKDRAFYLRVENFEESPIDEMANDPIKLSSKLEVGIA